MVVLLVGCLKASSSASDEMDHHSEELKEEMKVELKEAMKVELREEMKVELREEMKVEELKMEVWFHHWWDRGTWSLCN